jgi:rubrerythrin
MLSTARAIREAIDAEYAAARFFDGMARHAVDDVALGLFSTLAASEREHARAIERERERIRQGEVPGKAEGPNIALDHAPRWDSASQITLAQAIGFAVETKRHAVRLYDAIADCVDRDGSRFFRELAQAEDDQARQLEEHLRSIGQ